jgi:hypothetical protein
VLPVDRFGNTSQAIDTTDVILAFFQDTFDPVCVR